MMTLSVQKIKIPIRCSSNVPTVPTLQIDTHLGAGEGLVYFERLVLLSRLAALTE